MSPGICLPLKGTSRRWCHPIPFSHRAPPTSCHTDCSWVATGAIFLLHNPSCPSKVVANLFFGHAQVLARQRSLVRRSSTRTRRYKAPTVAARFQQSLLDLVEKMERLARAGHTRHCWREGDSWTQVPGGQAGFVPCPLMVSLQHRCNPFFVRCLKPNNKKVSAVGAWCHVGPRVSLPLAGENLPTWPPRLHSLSPQEPGLFEADVVSSQLRYSGILETIRIRKEGFPIRIPFLVFIDRCRECAGWWLWVEHCQLWGTHSRELRAPHLGFKEPGEVAIPGNGEGPCQHGGRSPTWWQCW